MILFPSEDLLVTENKKLHNQLSGPINLDFVWSFDRTNVVQKHRWSDDLGHCVELKLPICHPVIAVGFVNGHSTFTSYLYYRNEEDRNREYFSFIKKIKKYQKRQGKISDVS